MLPLIPFLFSTQQVFSQEPEHPGYGINDWSYDSGTAIALQGNGEGNVIKNNILSGVTEDKGITFWDEASRNNTTVFGNDYAPSGGNSHVHAPIIVEQPQNQVKLFCLVFIFVPFKEKKLYRYQR